jgi:hypothetical protein
MNLIDRFLGSFDNSTPNSLSGRKLSAFAGVVTGIVLTYLLAPEYELHALYAWLLFSLLCLSVITAQQIINFKNGNSPNNATQDKEG